MIFKRIFLLGSLFFVAVMSFAKININTATIEELITLHGIGTQKAAAIVKYRNDNGKFSSVEELVKVKGLGEKTLEQLKAQLTVGAEAEKDDAKNNKKDAEKNKAESAEKTKSKPVTKPKSSSKKDKK